MIAIVVLPAVILVLLQVQSIGMQAYREAARVRRRHARAGD